MCSFDANHLEVMQRRDPLAAEAEPIRKVVMSIIA
jgi:hypothetical protein